MAGEQTGLGTEQTERGLAALVARMADGFSRLLTQHVALARVELVEDLRALGADVAKIAVFVPFLLVGYLFLCGALAVLLGGWIDSYAGALALIGAANLVGGGLGIMRAASRLRERRLMDDSTEEFGRSVAVLASAPAKEPPHGR